MSNKLLKNPYIDPNKINHTYPKTKNSFVEKEYSNSNLFMKRNMQNIEFINDRQTKKHNHIGMNTRGKRKLDNTDFNQDLYLRRSMQQSDFRHGNRFYEVKPKNTRRDNYREIGNLNARKIQEQTKEIYHKNGLYTA